MATQEHPGSNAALEVYFDESGFTGQNLLDPAQRFFTYASVAISDEEAHGILAAAQTGTSAPVREPKAGRLLATAEGRTVVSNVLAAIEGRYAFVVQDKLVVLCGKVFEYIFEPVLQSALPLLYSKNLHKFVAMYCFVFFTSPEGERALTEFQQFMRTLDPSQAPMLFDPSRLDDLDDRDPFKSVLRFAQGYRDIIVADNTRMGDQAQETGRWALDVSVSGLWGLLNHWGETGRPLRVTCDDSRPLRDQVAHLTGGRDDPGIRRVGELGLDDGRLGWTLERPIAFGESHLHPGLQLADLVAGTAARLPTRPELVETPAIHDALMRHSHRHSIMPDYDQVQLGTRAVDVNWLVLMELGERASRRADPTAGLRDLYDAAEASWSPAILGD